MTNAALIDTLIALDERLTALGFSVGDPTIDAKVDAIVIDDILEAVGTVWQVGHCRPRATDDGVNNRGLPFDNAVPAPFLDQRGTSANAQFV